MLREIAGADYGREREAPLAALRRSGSSARLNPSTPARRAPPTPRDPMLDEIRFPDPVRAALAEGKLWRAKEILRGRIGGQPYSPELYEQYGAVLLEMRDVLQAGKYLFLSGRRRPEYAEAIELFLSRHGRRGGRGLVSAFPNRVRSLPLSTLPGIVRDELRERGLPEGAATESLARAAVPLRARVAGALAFLGCLAVILFLTASLLAGIPMVARYLLARFPG